MIFKDKRGNLHNIERFESLAFCHSSSAGPRFDPYTAHQKINHLQAPSLQPPLRVGSRTVKIFFSCVSHARPQIQVCGKSLHMFPVKILYVNRLVLKIYLPEIAPLQYAQYINSSLNPYSPASFFTDNSVRLIRASPPTSKDKILR